MKNVSRGNHHPSIMMEQFSARDHPRFAVAFVIIVLLGLLLGWCTDAAG